MNKYVWSPLELHLFRLSIMQYVSLFSKGFDWFENAKSQLTLAFWSLWSRMMNKYNWSLLWLHLFRLCFLQYVLLIPRGFDCLENAKSHLHWHFDRLRGKRWTNMFEVPWSSISFVLVLCSILVYFQKALLSWECEKSTYIGILVVCEVKDEQICLKSLGAPSLSS